MKYRPFLLFTAILSIAFGLHAQTNIPPTTNPPVFGVPTNALAPVQALANMLPYWDPTLTNTYSSGETVFKIQPLWKTQTAAGSTPYMATSWTYFFSRMFGAEGEFVSFGNGSGVSTADSAAILLNVRKDVGNLAGYVLAGPSRDFHLGKFGADVGLGFELCYKTRVGISVDTRYRWEGNAATENGFLTRAGITLHF
jgi:hypothetical protein